MDDELARQRIEIELTQHDGSRRRGRRSRHDAATPAGSAPLPEWRDVGTQPEDGAPPWSHLVASHSPPTEPAGSNAAAVSPATASQPVGSDRNRLVVVGLVVGIVAMFVGWALGRAGGDDGAAQTVDATAGSRVTTSVPSTLLPGGTLPIAVLPTVPAGPPTTRRSPSTTTTLPPAWVATTVEIDPRLAGSTDRLVGIALGGSLVELDLATGELSTLERRPRNSRSFSAVVAGDDWIVVMTDGGAAQVYRRESAAPESIDIGSAWDSFWQPGTDRFWRIVRAEAGQRQRAVEVTVDGQRTGVELTFADIWPSGADPAGGLVVGDGSFGGFVVTVDGSSRLPGRVVAAGVDRWLVIGCGETIDSCGPRVVERSTGEVRELVLDPPDARIEGLASFGPPGPLATISPDGRRAAVASIEQDGPPGLAIVDLDTGAVTEAGVGFASGGVAWSADGRFVFVTTTNGFDNVEAFDTETGETLVVAPELGPMTALTARPPVAPAGE